MNGMLKVGLTASLMIGLGACGNESSGVLGVLAQTAGQVVAERRGTEQPVAPPKSPREAAAEALRVNPNPLIQASFENLGRTQIMAMTGQNRDLRTYMTPAEEALILRNGILIGTRGMGHDLSVAETETEGPIRAGAAGHGTRVMRYFAGDGFERPLQFTCTVEPKPQLGGSVERCEGHGTNFQNSYIVQGGQIAASRQWIGPNLGYVTIQALRP